MQEREKCPFKHEDKPAQTETEPGKQVCRMFAKNGQCKFGEACKYAHECVVRSHFGSRFGSSVLALSLFSSSVIEV